MSRVAAAIAVVCIAVACADQIDSAFAQPVASANRSVTEVIPELIASLQPNWPQKEPAIRALGHIGNNQQPSPFEGTSPPPADPVARQRLDEFAAANRQRRASIYAALQPAAPALLRIAGENDPALRRLAIWALGAIRATPPEAMTLARSVALDTSRSSLDRQTAIVALAQLNAAEGRALSATIMATPNVDPGLFHASLAALQMLRAEGVPELRALLRDPDPWRRSYAITALAAVRDAAAPAAAEAAAALQPALPLRAQESAVRAVAAIAPNDITTLERVVANTAFSNPACQAAGQLLGQKPGALTFDHRRCAGHQPHQPSSATPDHIQRALLAAAGGSGDLVVSSTTSGYGTAPLRVIAACIEPRGNREALRTLARSEVAKPPAAAELRIAAVRVAGDDTIIDATGGLVTTGTPMASCSELQTDSGGDAIDWPVAELKLETAQAVGTATTYMEWTAQLDLATRAWRMRIPLLVYHLRADGTIFSDQLGVDPSDLAAPAIVSQWSGIEPPVQRLPISLAVRYKSMPSARLTGIPPTVIDAAPFTSAQWNDVVMYPIDMSGVRRSKPVMPEGLAINGIAGALIVPYPPDEDNRLIVAYWRKQLAHPHRMVRLTAAGKLGELKDRDSLPAIAKLLSHPDPMGQAIAAVTPFGAQALPFIEPLLKHANERIRTMAWSALAKMGTDAMPIYRRALDSGTPADQQQALKSIEHIRPSPAPALVPQLIALLDRCEAPAFQLGCFEVLNLLRTAGPAAAAAQPALEKRLERTAGWNRLSTATTLRAVGGSARATPIIEELARTAPSSDARNAIDALSPAESLPVFIAVLQRRDAGEAAAAAAARRLGQMSPAPDAAWPAIAALARDEDPRVRARVLPAFTPFQSAEALALLGGMMRDPDIDIRRTVYPLLEARGAAALPYVLPLLDDAGNTQRYDLLRFIERLGPAAANANPGLIKRIEALAADQSDRGMSVFASGVLRRLRGEK